MARGSAWQPRSPALAYPRWVRWSGLLLLVACGGGDPATPADAPAGSDAAGDPPRLVVYASGTGNEIAWYTLDAGGLTEIDRLTSPGNPSFLAVAPDGAHLYAVAEATSRVVAYRIDPADGGLTYLDDVDVGGNGPAHVAVDRTSHWVIAASYGDGAVSVFPILADGMLGAASQTLIAGSNAHQIVFDAANRFAFVPCLGSDQVAQYAFDDITGTLSPNAVPHLTTAAGAGPRHLAFAPDGTHAYLIDELDSTLMALAYDATTGRLSAIDTVSTLESPVAGNSGAELAVAGGFVYASNRGDNSIVTMAIAGDGRVTPVAWTDTGGTTPRHFSIAAGVLIVGNQGSDTIQPMAIDPGTGVPAASGSAIAFTGPEFTGIAALPASP